MQTHYPVDENAFNTEIYSDAISMYLLNQDAHPTWCITSLKHYQIEILFTFYMKYSSFEAHGIVEPI